MNVQELHILYVEDNLTSRKVLEMILKHQMKLEKFTLFEDSQDFVGRLDKLHPPPSLIFLDIHVKPHDGFEMLAQIRAHATLGKTPVVALTASVMNEEIEQLKRAGFDGVIGKPLDRTVFPRLVEKLAQGEQVWHVG